VFGWQDANCPARQHASIRSADPSARSAFVVILDRFAKPGKELGSNVDLLRLVVTHIPQ